MNVIVVKELLCGFIMLTDPSEVNDLPIVKRRSLSTRVLSQKTQQSTKQNQHCPASDLKRHKL